MTRQRCRPRARIGLVVSLAFGALFLVVALRLRDSFAMVINSRHHRRLGAGADAAWWNTMTVKALAKMEEHDEAARVAIIIDQMEDKGEPEEAAVRHAMRSLPWYYGELEERENKILNLASDDAGLPWILKERVVEAVLAGKIKKEDLEQSSSVNALVRRLMRAGSI